MYTHMYILFLIYMCVTCMCIYVCIHTYMVAIYTYMYMYIYMYIWEPWLTLVSFQKNRDQLGRCLSPPSYRCVRPLWDHSIFYASILQQLGVLKYAKVCPIWLNQKTLYLSHHCDLIFPHHPRSYGPMSTHSCSSQCYSFTLNTGAWVATCPSFSETCDVWVFCVLVCLCTMCMRDVWRGQRKASPGTGLQMVVNCHVGSGPLEEQPVLLIAE